jgi:putative nucleotidyltransferase with HDIG domain
MTDIISREEVIINMKYLNEKTIKNIIDYAKSVCSEFELTHDLDHIQRVVNLSVYLAQKENADVNIVKAAAWLHDIGYLNMTHKQMINEDHAELSSNMAKIVLKKQNLDQDIINHICECISSHRSSKITNNSSNEAKCVHDADKLDALGLRGSMRMLAWDLIIEPRGITLNEYITQLREVANRKEKALLTGTAKSLAKIWNAKLFVFIDNYNKESSFKD